jgi:hypothetical protein
MVSNPYVVELIGHALAWLIHHLPAIAHVTPSITAALENAKSKFSTAKPVKVRSLSYLWNYDWRGNGNLKICNLAFFTYTKGLNESCKLARVWVIMFLSWDVCKGFYRSWYLKGQMSLKYRWWCFVHVMQVPKGGSMLAFIWNTIVLLMMLGFASSIVTSIAQGVLEEEQRRELQSLEAQQLDSSPTVNNGHDRNE